VLSPFSHLRDDFYRQVSLSSGHRFMEKPWFRMQGPCLPGETRRALHKVKFSQVEDVKLAELVAVYGENDWQAIATHMPTRNVRQCRERWFLYLAPSVRKEPWEPGEEQLLLEKFQELGPKWLSIAKFFPGRTHVNVKNHVVTLTRRGLHFAGTSSTPRPPTSDTSFTLPHLKLDHQEPLDVPAWRPVADGTQPNANLARTFRFL
jgi:hypothetical protein